jgi:hypothetical protein
MRHAAAVRHFGRIETDPVTGKSGREQILQRMRSADVLLLVHGIEPICAEYIPSKMYEYLWMQRPILATVHCNAQMAGLLTDAGHEVLQAGSMQETASLVAALQFSLQHLYLRWLGAGLPDSGYVSDYSTGHAVQCLLEWANARNGDVR